MADTLTALSAKRALFTGLIDDASLYPPAALAMAPSLRAHGRDRESAYSFVQGRYVVPASRLGEMLAARDRTLTLHLSVILDARPDEDAVDGAIARLPNLGLLEGVDGVSVDSIEFRLPAAMAEIERAGALIDALAERGTFALWAEPCYDAGWLSPAGDVLPALAALRGRNERIAVGAKLRTGGATPNLIPGVHDVVAFIVEAEKADLAWKATAGLHHPVRRPAGRDRLPMHGFLNVFLAAIAWRAGAVEESRLADMLSEEDPRAFVVDPAHAAWSDVSIDIHALLAGRERCVSFGSCSFLEPVDDLRNLGILS